MAHNLPDPDRGRAVFSGWRLSATPAGSGTGVNPVSDDLASGAGAAYVFVRSGTTWSQQAYLKASNTGAGDFFGASVAVSGDTVVVGAPDEDGGGTGVNPASNGWATDAGAAYVFEPVPAKAVMTSPAPGSTLTSSVQTFTWSPGTAALQYWIYVGTSVGTYNILSRDMGLGRTRTVSGIPTNGSPIYVRLWTRFSTGWESNDYTYAAATAGVKAVMTSPAPGSTLTGSSVTFTWSPGTGALQYWIYVGTTGAGSHDVYSRDMGILLERWVSGLPTTGGTIYVRLWTRFASGWAYTDYTYTACNGCL